MIFHIAKHSDWQKQEYHATFSPADFQREGFVHCCRKEQIEGVLKRYFNGESDLLLLHIDEQQLIPILKYERSTGNEEFPHVYGPINREAIVNITSV